MKPARILIVEDEGVVVRDVRTLLGELGYEVVADTTLGEQAIVLAGQLRPSLVLMDIHLAGAVDGIAAARAIRDQFAIPVVFLTAFAGDDTLERAKLAEPLGYVLKPFEDRELRTAIELALFKHEAERQLRERDAEQESILRTALDGFWVVDTAGQILKVNDAYCRMVGYPREELLHLTVADLEVAESPDQVAAHSEQIRATGHACFESRHRHRDGHLVDLEISANFLPDGGGRFFAFLRDITERKRAQAALRQKEIEYRSLIENLASGLVVHGPDSAVRLNNPRAAELLGLTADQMRGKTAVDPAWQFLRADGTPAPLADYPVNRVLATGEPLKGFVLGIRRPDRAAPVWVLCDAYPVHAPGGPIAEVVVTFADITARKLAEEQAQALLAEAEKSRGVLLSLLEDQHRAGESLRQSEEKFSLAFQTSPYAITLTRVADGRLLEVNEAFVTLSGFSRKEALAQADLGATFWAHPEDWEEVVADLAQGQEVIAREYPFRRQTGEERAGLCSARTLQLGGEPCILASVNDITERKQSEQALRFTQFAMENAAEAIFWFTPEGRIEYANGAARRLLGYTEEEMLCLAITDVAEDLTAEQWPAHWAALKQARSMCFEARHRTKDGRSVPVEIQANFMAFGDREYDCGFVRDISERKRTELVQATLQELTQALSQAHIAVDVARCVFAAADRLWQWDSGVLDVIWPGTELAESVLCLDVVEGARREVPESGLKWAPPTPRMRRVMAEGAQLLLRTPAMMSASDSVLFGDTARLSASLMTVPIRRHGQGVGTLSIQSYTANAYTEADLTTLQSLADRCASALESIRAEEALRRDEARFRTLAEVLQFRGETTQDLLDFALQEAITLTGSQLGYLYQKSPAGPARYVLHTWATALKTSDSSRPHPELSAELDPASPAGAALHQREPVCVNDPPSQSAKSEAQSPKCEERGHSCSLGGESLPPSGQACPRSGENGAPASGPASPPHGGGSGAGSFFRHLAVPVISGGAVVAVVGVVNKGSRYDAGDTHQLRLLMEAVWKVIEQRQALADLRESEDRFRTLVETAPEAIFIQTGGCFAYVNDAARRLFGVTDAAGLIGQPVLSQFDPQYHAEVRTQIELTDLPSSILHPPASSLDPLSPLANTEEVCLRLAGPERDLYVSAVRFTYQGRPGALVFARDITERKRAEAALRESELRFRTLLQHVPAVAVQSYGADGITRYWNDASKRLYGYTASEALGRSILDLIIPAEMHAGCQQAMQQMVATGQAMPPGELTLRRKDGSPVLVFSSHALVQVPGQPPELFCLDLDLTERQRAEAALRQTQNDLAHAQAVSHTGSWQYDVPANVIQWSDETYRIFEIPLGQPVTHELFLARVHPEDRELLNPIQQSVRRGEFFEFRILVDERIKWVRERAELEFDAGGALLRAFGTVQDITERKAEEEKLQQSETKFSLAFQTAPYAVLITRATDGEIFEVNDAFETISGFTRAEVLGQSALSLGLWVDPADRQQVVEVLNQGRKLIGREAQFRKKDGHIITGLFSASSFRLNGEACVLSSISDISARKRAELIRETMHTLARLLGVASTPVEAARSVFAAADKFWSWDAGILDIVWPGADLVERVLSLDVMDGERRELAPVNLGLGEPTPRLRRILAHGAELLLRTPAEMQASDLVPFGNTTRLSASLMTVPIRQHGQAVGVLSVQSYTPNAFTRDDLDTLQSLADHCGGALERIRAQAATQESLLRYELVLAGAAGGIWDWDVPHQRVLFSSSWKALRGYSDTEVSDHETEWRSGIHPEDAPRVMAAVQAHFAGQTEVFQEEYRVRHKDGSWRWILDRGKAVRDAAGQVVRMAGSELDITERKRLEAALEHRLVALTRPLDQPEGITFEDLFALPAIQKLQDEFAAATGVASIITRPNGTPITQPSNFCRLCQDVIRCTEAGRRNCYHSDAVLGRYHPDGPIIQTCLSGGLWDAGASISVGDRHLANWLIGQVRDETQSDETIRAYAREIGADETTAVAAFREVPAMSAERFQQIAQALFTMAKQLSTSAYQNVQQARFIADRQQAEEALQQSQRLLAQTEKLGQVGGWEIDLATQKVVWTEVVYAIHELAPDYQPVVAEASRYFAPASWPVIAQAMQRVIEHGEPFDLELEIITARGNRRWVHNVGELDRAKGKVFGFFQDITERKQAEAALRRAEEQYRSIFENALEGIYQTTLKGNFLAANPAVARILGYESPAALMRERTNVRLLGYVDPERRAEFRRRIEAEGTVSGFEYEAYRRDGTKVWVSENARAIRDEQGQVIAYEGSFEDITKRKVAQEEARQAQAHTQELLAAAVLSADQLRQAQAETQALLELSERTQEQLLEAQATLQTAMDCSPAGIAIADAPSGQLRYVNRAGLGIRGGTEAELVTGVDLNQYVASWQMLDLDGTPLAPEEVPLTWAIQKGEPYSREFIIRRAPGDERIVLGNAAPVLDASGKVLAGIVVFMDITARKRAEAAQRLSEARFAEFMAHLPAAVFIKDVFGRLLFANRYFLDLPGGPGQTRADRLLGGGAQPMSEDDLRVMVGHPLVGEECVTELGGISRVFQTIKFAILVPEQPAMLGGIALDITERKEAEAALRASESRTRGFLEFAVDGILEGAPDGTILEANACLCALVGMTREAVIGKSIGDLPFAPESVAQQPWRFDLLQRGEVVVRERKLIRPDGSTVVIEMRSKQMPNGNLQSIFHDITARKADAAALEASEERLRLAMAAANMGTWDRDLTSSALRWSETEERLMGFAPGTFPGTSAAFLALLHPDSEAVHLAAQQRVRTGDGVFHAELHFRCADGRERWGLLSGQKILDASGQAVRIIGVDMDITERKRLEAEHATLEGQMRHAERLKSIGTLASGVAHEINNPINGVLNYAQMLLDQAEPGSRPAEFAAVILRESKRVIAIVRSLLQYSRQEPQPFSRVPVGELFEQSLSLLRAALRRDQIDLRVSVPADLPWLCCRGNQLQQVLVNLLTNARDALNQKYPGPDADKVLLLSAHTFQQADQPWLRFTVEDHGPGIPAALAERIFDPFFTTKQVDRGTGLGLSISHNLVQEHHGKLWVETEPGHWTRFHVDLPQEQTRKA